MEAVQNGLRKLGMQFGEIETKLGVVSEEQTIATGETSYQSLLINGLSFECILFQEEEHIIILQAQ